jgi:heterodisulfide reductase subunit A-like polyferredoxin
MYNKGTNAHDLLEVGRMIKEYLEVPKIAEYDVLVAGGGVAGVAAALTASRAGCKTLLMENEHQGKVFLP